MGWGRFNVPLDTFLGHFGDGGVAAASARIVATVMGGRPAADRFQRFWQTRTFCRRVATIMKRPPTTPSD